MTEPVHRTTLPAWRRGWRPVLALGIVVGLSLMTRSDNRTLAAWMDTATVSGTAVSTGTLAPPTALAVSQPCVSDPTPALRTPNGVTTSTSIAGTPLTIAKPGSAVVGDVLVATVAGKGNLQNSPPIAPSGWTSVVSTADNAIGQFVYTHVVGASEPGSYTWSGGLTPTQSAGGIAAYSGVDSASPVTVTSEAISTLTAPSITTVRDNVLLIGSFAVLNDVTVTTPPGMTSLWSAISSGGGGGGNEVTMRVATESWPTASATGTRTATVGGGARRVAQLIALRPPAYPYATITWTPSSSTFATGQQYRRTDAGTPQSPVTLGAAIATRSNEGPLVTGTNYSASVFAKYQNWVSTTPSVAWTARTCP